MMTISVPRFRGWRMPIRKVIKKPSLKTIEYQQGLKPAPDRRSCALTTYHDAPSWMADNKYILTGYRSVQYSYMGCIKSLLYIHNETGNIMTHLIAAFIFIGLWAASFYLYIPLLKSSTMGDYFALGTFMAGTVTCLVCSSLYHLFCCHSHETAREWNKMDYIGIVVQIVTAFFPPVYYGISIIVLFMH